MGELEKSNEIYIELRKEAENMLENMLINHRLQVAQYYEEVGKANYEFQYIIKSAGEEDRVNVDMRALRSLLRG